MPVKLSDISSQSSSDDLEPFLSPTSAYSRLPPTLNLLPAKTTSDLNQATSNGWSSISRRRKRRPLRFQNLEFCRQIRSRNRNFDHSSINKLPPGVLGLVFEYVCLSRPKQGWQRPFCPTTLGSICAYWHQVAWSNPRLWTNIRLDYGFWRAASRNHLVQLYIENSRGLGIHLQVRHAPLEDERIGTFGIPGGDVFDTLFVKNPHKTESLEFRAYVSSWLLHLGSVSCSGALTNLKRLRVKDSRDLVPVIGTSSYIDNVPSLREVEIDGLGGPFVYPWSQLSHLTLSVVHSDDAFNAIRQSTRLKSLHCLNLTYQDVWQPDEIPCSMVTFPYLEKIVWESTIPLSVAWDEALTRWFQFPALRSLTFNMPITVERSSSPLLNLPKYLSALSLQIDLRTLEEAQSCAIRQLALTRATDLNILRRVLASTSFLSTLTLQCDPEIDPAILDTLTLRMAETDLVPSLRELVLTTDSCWTSPVGFLALLQVLYSRWMGGREYPKQGLQAVGFVVPNAECVEQWPQMFFCGLQELVRQGLKVAVCVKGQGLVDINWFAETGLGGVVPM